VADCTLLPAASDLSDAIALTFNCLRLRALEAPALLFVYQDVCSGCYTLKDLPNAPLVRVNVQVQSLRSSYAALM